jgi:diphthamide synthase (EF-2-diphthine--ammonia ligase)
MKQLTFPLSLETKTILDMATAPSLDIDLAQYDKIIVYFSGGKDSLACLLHLLEQGVPAEKIELWHHEIDGREGSELMDWTCTPDYCRKVAQVFGIQIYFSWKVGGFEGEMTSSLWMKSHN